mgnify:CR=1 FL=1
MLNIKCGREITVQIPLDGTSPTLHARDAVVELDTIIPIENGVMSLNRDTNIALEVTDEILVTSPLACLRVYAPDVLEQIQQNFIRPCTL